MTTSEWTVETLRIHLTERLADLDTLIHERDAAQTFAARLAFAAQETALAAALATTEKAMQAAFAASDRAISKSEDANEKRFESVNEFRQALTDQTASFMPRFEIENRIDNITNRNAESYSRNADRINNIERVLASTPSNNEREAVRNAVDARFTALGDRLAALELRLSSRLDINEGRDAGVGLIVAWIFGGVGAIGAIVAIIFAVVHK